MNTGIVFGILIVLGLVGVIHELGKIRDILQDIQRHYPDLDDEDEDNLED
jgi:hypothetical protein